ncbi:MAG: hypothetical protein A2039_06375 [Candidatus Melainabacteria bacterium GWA2_34_9]|nr:MAG: hypothetical protein A2039_06375 [Candidatus Melainabacteria bacterium GWA2_34_9]
MDTKINIREFFKELFPQDKINNDDKLIKAYIEEAEFGFNRIEKFLDFENNKEFKILEVGAGSFLLTSYLAYRGLNITALEPVSGGFECFNLMQQAVLEYCKLNNINFKIIASKAEDFSSDEKYDFVFLVNVLEHIEEPFKALDNMKNVLKDAGKVFIHCPNYLIPYEPHFRMFLLPFGKKINEFIFKNKIKEKHELWNDLNFINYNQIVNYSKQRKLSVQFNHEIIYESFKRLSDANNKEFKNRIPKFIFVIYKLLTLTKLIKLLKLMPSKYQTPMEFIIQCKKIKE